MLKGLLKHSDSAETNPIKSRDERDVCHSIAHDQGLSWVLMWMRSQIEKHTSDINETIMLKCPWRTTM